MNYIHCTNCNKQNPEGSKFCQHCGIKFDEHYENSQQIKNKLSAEKYVSVETPPYPYVISVWKLIIMCIFTLGFYEIYWFYKQWKSFNSENNLKHGGFTLSIYSLFAPISSYSLFKNISNNVKEVNKGKGLEAGALAILYFILTRVYLGFLPLIFVQNKINFYWEKKYEGRLVKSNFGVWNWIIVIVVLIVGIFAITSSGNNASSQSSSSNPPTVSATPTYIDNQTLMQTNTQAVVNILCDNQNGGSGTVWVKDGLIVTNNHVIAGSTSCLVTIPDVATGAPVQIYQAKPLIAPYLSKQYDIALLSVYAAYRDTNGKVWGTYPISLHAFVPPSNCSTTQLGDTVRIYGYPVTSGGYNLTITDGIVSSFADDGNILTSAKIDSGNSGGLAVDKNGCMLGIPSAVLTGNYQNLGVIIPDNVIKDFITKASSQDTNTQAPTDTPAYIAPQSYQQTNTGNDNPPAGGYQNYGWYMHNGQSMQYVDGNWYTTPQQDATPTSTQNWWGY